MRRVQVVGTSGSGKSSVAAALARHLGVAHVELDALHWLPGWTERPVDAFRVLLDEALAADGWVVDGNYGDQARAQVWARIDTLVWLDLPRSTVMRQVIGRTFGRWWKGELLWGTNREDLRKTLLSWDSVLWWAWSTHGRRRAEYERLLPTVSFAVIRLTGRREVDRWLAELEP